MLYLTTTRGFSSKWHAVRHCVARLFSILLLCAPCLALAATSIDVSSVTNVYFVTYDDYRDYVSNGVAFADSVISECDSLDSSIYLAKSASYRSIANSSNAYTRIETVRNSGNVSGNEALGLQSASAYTLGAILRSQECIDQLDEMSSSNAVMRSEALAVRSALLSDVPTYQIVVYEGQGGGGCSCPDYTGILNSIWVRLGEIRSFVVDIKTFVQDLYYSVPNFILGFEEGATGSTDWSDLTNSGIDGGNLFGRVVSNSWDYAYYANLYPQIQNGIFNDFPVTEGPAFLREMWNYILRPIAHVWSDADLTDNHMINAFRDFYFNRDVFPTNDQSSALWVQLAIDPNTAPLSVELSGIGFTNSVHVNVDNLQELADLLNVTINDYNTSTTTINESNEEQTDQIENDMDQGGDFEEEYANEGDLIGAYDAITNCIRAIQNIIPEQAPVPRFYVDYMFHFSGTIPPDGAIDIIQPIQAIPFEQTPYLQYLLQFLRAVFSVGWWILVIGLGVSVAKLLFRLTPFVFSLCLLIASGDPRPLAHAIPDLAKAFRGSGE